MLQKQLMKKIYFTIAIAMSIGISQAQIQKDNSKYAAHGITTVGPNATPSFSTKASYYSENFDSGWGNWVAQTQTGDVEFQLTSTGHLNNAGSTFFVPSLESSTPTQWVVFDSDAYGSSGDFENATLTSGRIDLTAAAGGPLKIAFDQFMAEWTSPIDDTCWVGISTDSIAWTEYAINDSVGRDGRPNPETILVNITNDYMANPDSVWIRFRWFGQWNYGWQIDNIKIEDLPLNDLAVSKVYGANIFTGYEYSEIPLDQAAALSVGAIVKNQGLNDQTNQDLTATLTGSISGPVAQGTVNVASLPSFAQDTFFVDLAYTPTVVETFTVKMSMPSDDNTPNDSLELAMEVTQDQYSHYRVSNSIVGFLDTSVWVAQGAVFTIESDMWLEKIQAKFAKGTNIGAQFYVKIHEQIDGGIQEAGGGINPDIVAETPFSVAASDTAVGAPWKTIYLVEKPVLQAGKGYIIELLTYDGGLEPMYLETNRDGNHDLSTTVYGPYGTGGAIERYIGWGHTPAIRLVDEFATAIVENEAIALLGQNIPNPFNNTTAINYSIVSTDEVSFKVVDVTGKLVMTINEGVKTSGNYSININAEDFPSGMYFYTLTSGDTSITKSMTVSK